MTNRELDVLIIGFSVGSLTSLWLGYHLRKRVERWQARRRQRADLSSVPRVKQDAWQARRRDPEVMPLKKRDSEHPTLRRTRAPMERTLIPVVKPTDEPSFMVLDEKMPIADALTSAGYKLRDVPAAKKLVDDWHQRPVAPIRAAEETTHTIRTDAVAALTGAGYKLRDALAALDACMLVERAGGLESWVAAALRRLTNTLRDTK